MVSGTENGKIRKLSQIFSCVYASLREDVFVCWSVGWSEPISLARLRKDGEQLTCFIAHSHTIKTNLKKVLIHISACIISP